MENILLLSQTLFFLLMLDLRSTKRNLSMQLFKKISTILFLKFYKMTDFS